MSPPQPPVQTSSVGSPSRTLTPATSPPRNRPLSTRRMEFVSQPGESTTTLTTTARELQRVARRSLDVIDLVSSDEDESVADIIRRVAKRPRREGQVEALRDVESAEEKQGETGVEDVNDDEEKEEVASALMEVEEEEGADEVMPYRPLQSRMFDEVVFTTDDFPADLEGVRGLGGAIATPARGVVSAQENEEMADGLVESRRFDEIAFSMDDFPHTNVLMGTQRRRRIRRQLLNAMARRRQRNVASAMARRLSGVASADGHEQMPDGPIESRTFDEVVFSIDDFLDEEARTRRRAEALWIRTRMLRVVANGPTVRFRASRLTKSCSGWISSRYVKRQ